MQVCGVEITESEVHWLEKKISADAGLSRSRLAKDLCERKNLVDRCGRPREVTARVVLRRLERLGVLSLPKPRRVIPRARVQSSREPHGVYGGDATHCGHLEEVEIVPVCRKDKTEHRQWVDLLSSRHYLGAGPLCGAQLRYLVRCKEGLLGALSFSASAWRVRDRDQWIGWSESARRRNLQLVINNSRFLLVPKIQNLASHVLSRCLERLPRDWYDRYGYSPLLVESFVDSEKFEGTCYRAAGWTHVGLTTGRGRHDRDRTEKHSKRGIFVYPLDPYAKEKLCVEPIAELSTNGDWTEEEFGLADLPDERLNKRLRSVARDFFARPTANIPQACGGNRAKTKGVYRLCEHSGVTMDKILKPHYEATLSRAAKDKVVLAVQDTTSVNYTTHPFTKDLGPIGSFGPQATLGLHVHSTLLVNTAGTPLGLLDVQCWARDSEPHGMSEKEREALPIEDKESYKWLGGFEATTHAQRRLDATRLVTVCDREADIFELFAMARQSDEHPALLVRAAHPRKIKLSDSKISYVWDHVQSLSCKGTMPVSVPRKGRRLRRDAILELRFCEVTVCPPRKSRYRKPVKLNAIVACETNPPAGEQPVQWLLLTTMPVGSPEEAAEKVAWYALRWQIEVFHRVLKSGCRIENRQLKTAHGLKACIAIDLVVAWRVFYLAKLGREVPDVPCDVFFQEEEWKALVCFLEKTPVPPPTPPTLREAIRMAASLGGFLGRKSDGEPGTQTLWLGLQRLDDIAAAFRVFAPHPPDTS